MKRTLRSRIHEMIPIECRHDIAKISFDIVTDPITKQHMLIDTMKRHIPNAVPLGIGTNRTAFKLDSFAIKCSYNSEGRTDSLREFYVAKQLSPYVTEAYEVTSDGTILISAYARPFNTYAEMMQYHQQGLEAIAHISKKYLIGDIGLIEKNCGNAGIFGEKSFVFIDTGYCDSVKSKVFTCTTCNGRLMYSANGSKLKCVSCQTEYTFESIRRRSPLPTYTPEDLEKIAYRCTDNTIDIVPDNRSPMSSDHKESIDKRELNRAYRDETRKYTYADRLKLQRERRIELDDESNNVHDDSFERNDV